jgi:hypothetical protein
MLIISKVCLVTPLFLFKILMYIVRAITYINLVKLVTLEWNILQVLQKYLSMTGELCNSLLLINYTMSMFFSEIVFV